MNYKKPTIGVWFIGMVIVSTIASSGVANASEDPTGAVADLVESAIASVPVHEVDSAAPEVDVSVPSDSTQAIIVDVSDGTQLNFALPLEALTVDGELGNDGSTVYHGIGESADVSVQPLINGVRVSTILDDSSAGNEFSYPLEDGIDPEVNTDGTISLFQSIEAVDPETGTLVSASVEVAVIQQPWAVDSQGDNVPTRYILADDAVVQVLDLSAPDISYPVVADPTFTTINPFQSRIRWNRAETATIASGGWGATGLTAVCGLAGAAAGGSVGAAAFAAVCFGLSAPAVYTAGVAQNSRPKRCLQLTITTTPVTAPIPYFDTYACR
ncbi:hypothetical protein JF66_19420 [Cryobacterium sp. MLB-32]|uniref:hypothetical protein n=1 Tax=Cryobacterium sp. MLB-32 TaxID=1529318 RepID=UPI0004E66DC3|nr:hypothetical protein [Cryobacterium sp. MLB-32]KFF58321.1 hypothetical protein JF66_19420 [Cryobacterium sp. MLB-32]